MFNKLIALCLALFLLTGCGAVVTDPQVAGPVAGDVWQAYAGTTLYHLNAAFQGTGPGAQILVRDGHYVVVWAMENGYGFTLIRNPQQASTFMAPVIDWVKATGGKGNIASKGDIRLFLQYMESEGFTRINASDVPTTLRDAVATAWAAMRTGGQAAVVKLMNQAVPIISILVMPISPTGEMLCPEDVFGPGVQSMCGATRMQ